MLLDEVEIILRGGHGGPGRASFNPGQHSGPNGGNGGKGGDIYIVVTSDLRALNQFSKTQLKEAENGEMGGHFQQSGRNGYDMEIEMSIGTELTDLQTGEVFILDDLSKRIMICKGGIGGKGNFELKSPRRTTPLYAQKGMPGQERNLLVELKFIADFGLIGLPNAGKSSLLNEITNANVKTADYPFTTLEANLGMYKGNPSTPLGRSGRGRVIADIPGLIEGASEGKGLGIRFLKHIEKVKLLLHCVPADSDDVIRDYEVVRNELGKYNPELLTKEEIIILSKTDMLGEKEIKEKMKSLKKFKRQIIPVSIHDWDSMQKLQEVLK